MYLQCYGTGTGRRATIIFYAICLLYVLSTLDFVSDLATLILQVSDNYICRKNIFFFNQLWSRGRLGYQFFPLSKS